MALKYTYNRRLAEAVWWNLLLLTIGGFLLATGVQAVAAPHNFLTGGMLGAALLVWYATQLFSVPIWYLALCLPICVWGWFFVGRRFLLYTTYGTLCTSLFGMLINFQIPVENTFYAAVLAGVLNGAAAGIMLHSGQRRGDGHCGRRPEKTLEYSHRTIQLHLQRLPVHGGRLSFRS